MDMKKDIQLKHYNLNLVDFKKMIFFQFDQQGTIALLYVLHLIWSWF